MRRTARALFPGLALIVPFVIVLGAALEAQRVGAVKTPGALVAVGGGGTSEVVLARALEKAGGSAARVVVLPQASERADAGEDSVEMWRAAGAREATLVRLDESEEARRAIRAADLIWMPGGDQVRLLAALEQAGLVEELRARHASGAVVGGTSAGAAVLSERMITGNADLERIAAGATETVPGLDLWHGVIVDQHALLRQRLNRLIAAVLDHPGLVGVAVDERTAVIVEGRRFEVLGESAVVVVDARRARVSELVPGEPSAGTDLALHVLRAGMTLDLAESDR